MFGEVRSTLSYISIVPPDTSVLRSRLPDAYRSPTKFSKRQRHVYQSTTQFNNRATIRLYITYNNSAMDRTLVTERFAVLASSDSRSKMARFREVFPCIQAAIEAGVTRATARDELARLGLDLTYKTFTIYLDRVRKERASLGQVVSNAVGPKAASPDVPVRASDAGNTGQNSVFGPPVRRDLPDDWRTCKPFPGLSQLLTPEQKKERTAARDRKFDPSVYDPPETPTNRSASHGRETP
jgi:hypothetical protein